MEDDLLVCPICGAHKRHLTKHITMLHHLTKSQIYEKFGDIKLISNSTHNKLISALYNNWNDPEYAERCSSYFKSNLHRERCRERMTNYWKDDDWVNHTLDCMRNITESQRTARSESLRQTVLECWKDPEYVKRRRIAGHIQMAKNMGNPNWGKSTRTVYNGVSYRSKLEVSFAQLLDELGIIHQYETIKLPYVDSKGINRTYYVDFYLPQYKSIVELKPEKFLDEITNEKSLAACRSPYWFIIVTEFELSQDSILELLSLPAKNVGQASLQTSPIILQSV